MQTARVFELTPSACLGGAKLRLDRGGSAIALKERDEEIQVRARGPSGARGVIVDPAHSASRTGEPEYHLDDVWPDDADVVPDWRIKAETRAQITELDLVSYRTKREFLAAVAACEARLKPVPALALVPPQLSPVEQVAEIVPETVSTLEETFLPLAAGPFAKPCLVNGREPLPPEIAARKFLAWLIATHRTGRWSHKDMADFYAIHCKENSLTPTRENVLREALKRLPGASKNELDVRSSGKRVREVSWSIEGTAPMKTRKPNEKGQRRAA